MGLDVFAGALERLAADEAAAVSYAADLDGYRLLALLALEHLAALTRENRHLRDRVRAQNAVIAHCFGGSEDGGAA